MDNHLKNMIEKGEIKFSFIKSSGPGGQNINKVSTGVQLKYNAKKSKNLPDKIRERLFKIAAGRINIKGILIIEATRFRSQEKNKQDALNRLFNILREASRIKKPRKRTYPSIIAKEMRIRKKKRLSEKKNSRKRINHIV